MGLRNVRRGVSGEARGCATRLCIFRAEVGQDEWMAREVVGRIRGGNGGVGVKLPPSDSLGGRAWSLEG
jgi:hypothetical protein